MSVNRRGVHDRLLLSRKQDVGQARIEPLEHGAKVDVDAERVFNVLAQKTELERAVRPVAACELDVVVVSVCGRVFLTNCHSVLHHVLPVRLARFRNPEPALYALDEGGQNVSPSRIALELRLVRQSR